MSTEQVGELKKNNFFYKSCNRTMLTAKIGRVTF